MRIDIVDLLQELRRRSISLSLHGEQLKTAAPAGALTPELREQLLQHKPSLLQWLKEQNDGAELPLPICQPDPANLYQPFPLADLQLGFYMADDPYMEFHVRPHYYNEMDVADLDVARYEAAWNRALRRHRAEIVKVTPDGQLQTECDPAPLRCQVHDLRASCPKETQQALMDVRAQMMRAELPLDRWPWIDLRVSLWVETGKQRARIHYNHNNFFSDGYGTTRLLQEIDLYYHHPDTELPKLSLSFRDAALALDALAQSPAGKTAQRYWEGRLDTLPEPPSLPIRTNLNRRCRSRLQRREGFLSAGAWVAFKAQAAHFGVSPSNAIFCAYAELVSAWSNSRHFVLSNMMTRRLNIHPEMRDIIGNFASLYPLEIDFRATDIFLERARRMQEQVIRDARYLQWGGMQVMQAWNRRRGTLGTAAIPFVVGSALFMEGFKHADFSCLETSQTMLDHQFCELDDGRLFVMWDVLEEFFLPGVVDHMWEAYSTLLERLATDPALWKAASLDLLPVEQLAARQHVTPPPQAIPDMCLDNFLPDTASQIPNQVAIRVGNETLDYATLHATSIALAARLRDTLLDIHGKNIVIIAERGTALVQAVYAVMQTGAAYVPVDPELPAERQRYIIENSEAVAVLVQRDYLEKFHAVDGIAVLPIEDSIDAPLPKMEEEPRQKKHTSTDLAYLIYTSGSTGRPKGVMIEHRGAINTVLDINQRFGVNANDRIFGVSSFGFDLSVYDLFGSAAAGATLVYPDPAQSLNPSHWLDVLLQEKVTVWNSVPPLAFLLIETAENRGVLLPDLRLLMLSGDWIPIDLPTRIKRIAPNARIVSLGGATEASIWSIFYNIESVHPEWQSIPYGTPMQNQPWYVLDAWGRPTPDWTTGELYIGGIGLARGYWNDPEKTAAAFIAHPTTGERIYRTGDMGCYQPGGVIEFLGRRDLQVKIQGNRIELGEIESVLAADPAVSTAVVTVQGSNANHAHLVAYVVPTGTAQPDTKQLQDTLAKKLPAYMVPRTIQVLDRLPLNSNGKVDRKALPAIEMQTVTIAASSIKRDPMDAMEARLLAIWRTTLNQPDMGVTDDFFDCGGQSFEAVRVVGAIREAFGQALSLGTIWQERTVERIATVLRHGPASSAGHLVSLSPPSPAGGMGEPTELPKALTNDLLPLTLIHPAGGHVLCYRQLAEKLSRPVYGFRAPGLEQGETPPASIEAFAKQYVTELDIHQPTGQLLLGGWSSGALIAFEMATQLRQKGREVAGVVMFDCPAPLLHNPIEDKTLLAWFLEDLALDLPVAKLIATLNIIPTNPEEQLTRIFQQQEVQERKIAFDLPQMTAIYRVFTEIVKASRCYHASRIDIDVLLIRAEDGVVSEFTGHPLWHEPDWGWRQFCKNIKTENFPGTHYTLLSNSTVEELARVTERWLAQIG